MPRTCHYSHFANSHSPLMFRLIRYMGYGWRGIFTSNLVLEKLSEPDYLAGASGRRSL